MPYAGRKNDIPFASMRRLLLGYGISATMLSKILEVSFPTAAKKLANPKTLTLADLALISRRGHVPMEEIRDEVRL